MTTQELDSIGDGGHIAFAITVAVGLVSVVLSSPQLPLLLPAIVLGVVYSIIGTVGFDTYFNEKKGIFLPTYFVVQTLLSLGILWLVKFDGLSYIIIIPLASHAVIAFENRIAIAYVATLVGLFGGSLLLIWQDLDGTISATLGVSAFILFVMVFTAATDRERRLREEVEVLNEQLRDYAAQSAELATAQERNRLAREIHDSLGHVLTTVTIQLEAASQLIERDPEKATEIVQKAHTLTKQGLGDVREAVAGWRTSPLTGRSLVDAIGGLADTARAAGLAVDVTIDGENGRLPPQTEHTLYRAAQEALTNIQKHADAEHARITLSLKAPITLTVENDGDPVESTEPSGYGLMGVRERVQMLGGEMAAHPIPEGGFRLHVEIPHER